MDLIYEKRIQSRIFGFGVTRLGLFCSIQIVNGKFHPMLSETFVISTLLMCFKQIRLV